MNVLIVEDNHQVAETIADFLMLEGINVECAHSGVSAISFLSERTYDVIVMDIMMPKLNGISATQQIRDQLRCQTPILFLTAKDGLADKQAAYDAGGDDYLVKPFAMRELLMRLNALHKRGPIKHRSQYQFGELVLDTTTFEVSRSGKPLKLSHIQFKILQLLIMKAPTAVSKDEMHHHIWGDEIPTSDALRSHVYTLRNIIDKGFDTPYLETLHGKGYRLCKA